MSLKDCGSIDKQLLKAYQYHLHFMSHDAKHRGRIGLQSFTKEFVSVLLRDLEVYITHVTSLPAHALCTSLEEAIKQYLWKLVYEIYENKIPSTLSENINRINQFCISGKRTIVFQDSFDHPYDEIISFDHTHIMNHAIMTTCALGFILRDFNMEFASRLADELLLNDKNALGSPNIVNWAILGAIIGDGNKYFFKYSILGHIYLFICIIIGEACKDLPIFDVTLRNRLF